ncbi:16S rRNA (guanine(966)-N(2))-methyltransferase RsmD [Massilia arenosa]|uniref:16S rRNA (Guanine(966)-N(2))-methyltransferase RsmD n=1 Tax=Zemynaea arenosa TaxID=2561931 RepID=A0A4Y9SNH2_9BURK|nr:16S rRNA (guanine(966)-N(2))-methyltransferase RsmD [Massilia arenosa]TFW28165.1 16S rRNA (guanine(966)-N(2))-methyltransferase RsmD [Massilia arenosa]
MYKKSSSGGRGGARSEDSRSPQRTLTRHTPRLAPQSVRIIGGTWKRTPLPVLDALGLRPTPDRVRETIFNWINHQFDGVWSTRDCLDLFAGSGALGFEAASRGAASVILVDAHQGVVRQLQANKDKLEAANLSVVRGDALTTARNMAARGQTFDLIFLDPPYQQDLLATALPLCLTLLKPGGLVYAESGLALPFDGQGADAVPQWLQGWEAVRADKAGMVYFHLLRRSG